MVAITGLDELPSFAAVRDHVLNGLRYPLLQANKLESYGWVPTLYMPNERIFTSRQTGHSFTRFGCWRNGAAENPTLSLFYADVDNADTGRPTVSMQSVAAALDARGLTYFMYTSFSHTAEKPKFRVVIDTDRDLTRVEMLRIAVLLNRVAFGQQADLSIYDPGDFVFAPPHNTTVTEHLRGLPLTVDAALAEQHQLEQHYPCIWTKYVAQKQTPEARIEPTPEQVAAMKQRRADRTARPEMVIDNPTVFNQAWAGFYRERITNRSHFETMRSLLGMVWAKTAGALSYGEVDQILRQIDATAGGYFIRQHGEQKAADLIDWLMSLPVEEDEDAREWNPLLERDESGLTVQVKEGECGEGKTRDELTRMARAKGRYVYVVDKIATIEQRKQEFFEIAGRWTAMRFRIEEAHSEKQECRVPVQLAAIRKDLDKEPAGRPAIVFVTQAGAAMMDWSAWGDCEVIFDEVPDCFTTFRIDAKNHAEVLRRYVHVEAEDGGCYSLGSTGAGRELARTTDVDDYDKVHHGLCVLLSKPNTHVWVKQKAWDNPAEGGRLEFFAVTSPLNLCHFSSVRLLGDEAMKAVTVRAWTEKWGVTFEPITFERRKRLVPTADRVTIRYFSDHRDSSITRFHEGDLPLESVTAWIKQDAAGEPVLWTANEKLRGKAKLDQRDFISPKAHGRNDLQHYKRVAWLAAMKPSQFEVGSLREVCGMTAAELTEWREFNAMYQFVMRCVLRDFSSAEPAVVYVFSRKQAEYLKGRLGGTIEKVPGVVEDKPVRCIDEEGAMTDAERSLAKYWREKMLKAGVTDVRLLPKAAQKLDERKIRLVNATFEKLSAEAAPKRLAA
ncbi:hypothetical protein [Methylobacterium soli]|uniref:Uncharacterized protein n=1 Tax=Methylobacterium soli TaxID=553447 RepID=A0A6L3SNH9_9HYPH|nr:hypothetical protein [Methylobacterium soli]KAB1068936.1 hypothetical protein F6X53_31180 [Methylobacterium soli]